MSLEKSITGRYNGLAESACCLSCGSAVSFGKARAGEVCVDLGSGRGTDVLRLAETVGPGGFAYGIDLSEAMIAKARRTAEQLGITNAGFINSPLEKLPLENSIADLVLSNCTINHASDKQAVWNEIYRILKKGGRFAVSDIYAIDNVPDEFRNDPDAVAECWAGAITKELYLETIARAGFVNVTILEESRPYGKGKIQVASFTITGSKPSGCCCK